MNICVKKIFIAICFKKNFFFTLFIWNPNMVIQNLFSLVVELLCHAEWYYGMFWCFCNIKKNPKQKEKKLHSF